jgi:hypothetical protein
MELRHVAVVSSRRELINETACSVTETRERKSACRINSGAINEVQERENGAEKRARRNDVRKNSGLCDSKCVHLSRNSFHRDSYANATSLASIRISFSVFVHRFDLTRFLLSILVASFINASLRIPSINFVLLKDRTQITSFYFLFAMGICFL